MLTIPCPHCGPRNEDEFVCWSEAEPARPDDPAALDDTAWNDYLYMRGNPKGRSRERWFHLHGCGRWIVIERDTVSHAVRVPGADAP